MTEAQHWQLITGLVGLVTLLIGYIWLRQHHWIRNHEERLKVVESDHLKRPEFNGAMGSMRTLLDQSMQRLVELETESRVRSEYVKAQLQRLEDSQQRIEALLTSGKITVRRKSSS